MGVQSLILDAGMEKHSDFLLKNFDWLVPDMISIPLLYSMESLLIDYCDMLTLGL